jgi:hypothetical protein
MSPYFGDSRFYGKFLPNDYQDIVIRLRDLIRRDATLKISGTPASGISQDSTCICLPARSPALRDGGRGIFDQPEKK